MMSVIPQVALMLVLLGAPAGLVKNIFALPSTRPPPVNVPASNRLPINPPPSKPVAISSMRDWTSRAEGDWLVQFEHTKGAEAPSRMRLVDKVTHMRKSLRSNDRGHILNIGRVDLSMRPGKLLGSRLGIKESSLLLYTAENPSGLLWGSYDERDRPAKQTALLSWLREQGIDTPVWERRSRDRKKTKEDSDKKRRNRQELRRKRKDREKKPDRGSKVPKSKLLKVPKLPGKMGGGAETAEKREHRNELDNADQRQKGIKRPEEKPVQKGLDARARAAADARPATASLKGAGATADAVAASAPGAIKLQQAPPVADVSLEEALLADLKDYEEAKNVL